MWKPRAHFVRYCLMCLTFVKICINPSINPSSHPSFFLLSCIFFRKSILSQSQSNLWLCDLLTNGLWKFIFIDESFFFFIIKYQRKWLLILGSTKRTPLCVRHHLGINLNSIIWCTWQGCNLSRLSGVHYRSNFIKIHFIFRAFFFFFFFY